MSIRGVVALLLNSCIISSVLVTNVYGLFVKDFAIEPRINLEPGDDFIIRNYIGYYMYNITNPDEVEAGDKPILSEEGPYVYRETRRKFDVKKASESTLKYKLSKYWEFMPELSDQRKETDLFNVINIPMLILANKLAAKNLPTAFNNILVDELLEKGDSLIRRNEQFGNFLYHGVNVSIYTEILDDVLQGNVPTEYANGLFALYKKGNNTVEGEYLVKSKGANIGSIISFNNSTKLEYWGGDYCNKIEGTDGYTFPPMVSEKAPLNIFYPELCRSVYLKFNGKTELNEIPVDRFTFPEEMLEDPMVDKRNLCFCSHPIRPTNISHSSCLKKGFIDFGVCKQDSPLLLSYPHFLYADEEYLNATVGLTPSPEKHSTEFLVEPRTGTVVKAVRKFQFNVKLRPLDNVDLFKNVTNMIFPVFWTYRKMEVNESSFDELKDELKKLADAKNNKDLYQHELSSANPSDEAEETNNLGRRVGEPSPEGLAEPGAEPGAEPEFSITDDKSSYTSSSNSNGASLPASSVSLNIFILLISFHILVESLK